MRRLRLQMMAGGLDPVGAFLAATGITDATIISALNTLYADLVTYGIWTKMKAIYPFVGGTATTHKFNLKDPQDTNAAFRLVFTGGWVHSATGALPNGINAYADTFFIPDAHLSISSAHFSKYNRNNNLTPTQLDGASDLPSDSFFQHNYTSGNGIIGNVASVVTYIVTDTKGLFTLTRTSSNLAKLFRNPSQVGINTTVITQIPSLRSIFIGGRNAGSLTFPNSYEAAFASVGDGLTDTEATNLYTAVQAFQTTLGRQV